MAAAAAASAPAPSPAAGGGKGGSAPTAAPTLDASIEDIRHLLGDPKRYKEAKAKLDALNLPKDDGTRRVFEAAICLSENDLAMALSHALFAVYLRRGLWAAFTLAARAYIKFGALDEAESILMELNGEHEEKNDVEPAVRRQLVFFREQGKEMLKWVAGLKRKRRLLTALISKPAKRTQTTKLLDQLLAECPAFDELHAARLELYEAMGMYEAITSYYAALDPFTRSNPDVRCLMAISMLYTGGNREFARLEFISTCGECKRADQYLTMLDRMTETLVAARATLAQGRYEEVQAMCDAAMRIDPKVTAFTSDIKCVLSELHLARGDLVGARRYAHEAVTACATNHQAFICSALVCFEMGNYDETMRLALQALDVSPDDADATRIFKKAEFRLEMQKTNHYEVLGVAKTATDKEIRTAWRQRVLKHYPDRASVEQKAESEERSRRYNEAYEVLKDPVARSEYDRSLQLQDGVDALLQSLGVRPQRKAPPPQPPMPQPRRPAAAAAAAAAAAPAPAQRPAVAAAAAAAAADDGEDLTALLNSLG